MAEAGGWSTIESDEGVFTSLIENLGVKNVQFEELISLDADTIRSLRSFFPLSQITIASNLTSQQSSLRRNLPLQMDTRPNQTIHPTTPQDGTYDDTAAEKGVFFAAQTIQNACGTQAVLSVILNQDQSTPTNHSPIDIGDELRSFKEFTTGFPPELLGEALSNSESIRTAHNAFAKSSPFVDETARTGDEEGGDVFHFIAYTPVNGVLYELDGLQPYPISHGLCGEGQFPEKVIEVVERRIARYPEGETMFNLMAVVRDLR
ncbi:ubiquitin carboxyl-terminal hydrolase, partial [Aspergillus sclerotialis]